MIGNHDYSKGRGWVEVIPAPAGGFWVHDWSEHHDSGHIVTVRDTFAEALEAAKRWAREHGRKMETAEIMPFRKAEGDAW